MAEVVDDLALRWSGRALDVARIEAELGKLRYVAAGEPASGEGFALRTSLLNMVVYAEHEDRADHASRMIEDLASHHPSRALVLIGNPSDTESHIEAQLAAHCHISREVDQTVCCEEVTLRVSGRAAGHLHSLVAPLLIPDLPIYVWWTEPLPEENHQFHELLDLSDRLIVDSATFGDQLSDLKRLHYLLQEAPGATIGDLTWARVNMWRQLLRQQRRVQEVRHHMDAVTSVEVSYAGGTSDSAPAAQAYLFLGWIAEELDWDVTTAANGGSDEIVVLDRKKQPISLSARAVDYPATDPGSLVSVKIACRTSARPALVSVSRTGDPYHLTIQTEHLRRSSQEHLCAEPERPVDLLMSELDVSAHDREYARVLGTAASLIAVR
jgi:glucose-6-phosphate dehydrogenase assembly protein OpcA